MDVADEFGISKTQVYSIRKRKCALIGSVPLYAKVTSSKAKYPAIDRAVYEWFRSIRTLNGARKPLPVSRAMIKARALFEAKHQGVSEFSASNGWFYNWRWRCNICFKKHSDSMGKLTGFQAMKTVVMIPWNRLKFSNSHPM